MVEFLFVMVFFLPVDVQRVSVFTKGKDVLVFCQAKDVAFLPFAVEHDHRLAFQPKSQFFLRVFPLRLVDDDVEDLYVVGVLLHDSVLVNEEIFGGRMTVSFVGVCLLLFDIDKDDGAVPVKLVVSFLDVV